MIRRVFAAADCHITFTKDHREYLAGNLAPGTAVTLYYDAERLKQTRGPNWKIICCHKYHESGPILTTSLSSSTGNITTKAGNSPGGGTMLSGEIQIPTDAELFILWFELSDDSGASYYDSDSGRNFQFPFLSEDIRIASAEVISAGTTASSNFTVTVETAPDIDALVLDYRITNFGALAVTTTEVPLHLIGAANDSWIQWSSDDISVQDNAVIIFSVAYSKAGRRYFDDNNHRGYLAAPKGVDATTA
jgi:hypothetical protein